VLACACVRSVVWLVVHLTRSPLRQEDHGPYGDPLYYWFYFIFMNGIWMVIPAIAIVQSVRHSSAAHAFMRKNNVKKND